MADQARLEIAVDSRGAEMSVGNVRRELGKMERAGETAARAVDGVGESFDDMARSAGMYRDSAGRLREANGRFVSSAQKAEMAARSLGGELGRTSGGFSALARQSQLAVPPVGQLTALLGGLSGATVAHQVVAYSDAWQSAGNQLRLVTDSAEQLAGTQERLMQVANTTRSDFSATATLYSRLARSTTELGLSQRDLIGLTRTINQSFATNGATAAEAAGAITQLSQGLAAGALRGDEFNSVAEQAPGIMRAIAESLDMTIGELRAFAAEGGITAEIVVTALQESAHAIEHDFSQAVATLGQQMTVARNNLIQFVGGAESVEEGVANIGAAVVGLSENLDNVAQAAMVMAGVFGGRLAGRLVTVAAAMTTAAGAATALRTALAFLGGPVGVAVAAATALIAFREELGLVQDPAQRAREQMDLLAGSIKDVNDASLDGAMIQINAKLFEMEQRAREARQQLAAIDSDQGSGALGMAPGATGQAARLHAELGQIANQKAGAQQEMEGLLKLREGLNDAGEAGKSTGDALDRLGKTADDVVAKFKPMLDQDIENILDRAGPGATIDGQGRLRDAFGNLNRVLQGELESALLEQRNGFQSEQNLQAGLEGLLARMTGNSENAPALMATRAQDGAPAKAGKPMGSFTIRVAKEGEGDTEGEVQGDEEFIRKMATALGSVATAV